MRAWIKNRWQWLLISVVAGLILSLGLFNYYTKILEESRIKAYQKDVMAHAEMFIRHGKMYLSPSGIIVSLEGPTLGNVKSYLILLISPAGITRATALKEIELPNAVCERYTEEVVLNSQLGKYELIIEHQKIHRNESVSKGYVTGPRIERLRGISIWREVFNSLVQYYEQGGGQKHGRSA